MGRFSIRPSIRPYVRPFPPSRAQEPARQALDPANQASEPARQASDRRTYIRTENLPILQDPIGAATQKLKIWKKFDLSSTLCVLEVVGGFKAYHF